MPFSLIRKEIGDLVPLTPVLNGEIIDTPPPQLALALTKVVDGTFTVVLPPISPPYEYTDPDPPEPEQPPWYRGNRRVEIPPENIGPYEPNLLIRLVSSVVLGLFLPAPRQITPRR